jgi:hypothetical protein
MREWTFLQAYDYIRANPDAFHLCDHDGELSGELNCICVHYLFKEPDPISYSYAGKLRWRGTLDTGYTDKPFVDESLQELLNEHFALTKGE